MAMTEAQIDTLIEEARAALSAMLNGSLVDSDIGGMKITRSTTMREIRQLIADLEKQKTLIPGVEISHHAIDIDRFGVDYSEFSGDS